MKPKLSLPERQRIIRRIIKGETVAKICRDTGISRVLAYKWLKRYKELSSFQNLNKPQSQDHLVRSAVYPLKGSISKRPKYDVTTRIKAVQAMTAKRSTAESVCRDFNVSRTILYRWLKRYSQAGRQVSQDISAKDSYFNEYMAIKALENKLPIIRTRYPGQVSPAVEQLILKTVSQRPHLSVHKLVENLPIIKGKPVVGHKGIQNVLRRNNLSTLEKRLVFAKTRRTEKLSWIPTIINSVKSVFVKFTPQIAPAPPPAVEPPITPEPSPKAPGPSLFRTLHLLKFLLKVSIKGFIFLFKLPFRFRKAWQSFVIAFSIPILLSVSLLGFAGYLAMLATAPTLGVAVGYLFSSVALMFGFFFFLYSFKYYLSVIFVLNYSRQELTKEGDEIKSRNQSLNRAGLTQDVSDVVLDRHPFVSVHLPLYNEKRVVNRLLEAVTSLDYDNYEVVICDDSTDETKDIVNEWRRHPRIKISHRETRAGFKGAALKQALSLMDPKTEFVLVFDADFLPYPDTIDQFLKYFKVATGTLDFQEESRDWGLGSSKKDTTLNLNPKPYTLNPNPCPIAAIQGYQWHVLNKSENWVTRGVRTEYAGSYIIERSGAEVYGGLKQIAGSVYMIRADILNHYQWGTSITEDFELTLKLYADGYKVVYTPYIQTPSECVSTLKRLVRQRMRWAEGHSFNIKRMFMKLMTSSRITASEKLEFLYLSPYYLQSFFFLSGTLSWFVAETVFQVRLPFWTEVWGWSLVLTNMFSLPLMNLVGLFLEEAEEKDYLGILSFVALTYLIAPFQAYAAVRGFLQTSEGPWFRTPKTGRITDVYRKGRFYRFIQGILPRRQPSTVSGQLSVVSNQYLSLSTANNSFNQFFIKPRKKRWIGNLALAILVFMTSTLTYYFPAIPQAKLQVSASENKFINFSQPQETPKDTIDSQMMIEFAGATAIFHKEPRVRYKFANYEAEFTTVKIEGLGKARKGETFRQGPLITYSDVFDKVDIVYKAGDEGVNESFLIKEYKDIEYVEQRLRLTEMIVGTDDTGQIFLAPENGGESVFFLEKPYLFEEKNPQEKNYGIEYQLEKKSDSEYLIRKVLTAEGKEWLADPGRKFPVVIDPTIYKSMVTHSGEYLGYYTQYGSNQRKIAYMPNATGGAAWYAFYAQSQRIRYRKCIASTNCDDPSEWDAFVEVDVDADNGEYSQNIWVEGDTIWIVWVDAATANTSACCNATESIQWRSLDTTTDGFGSQCSTQAQTSLDPTNFAYIAVGDNGDVIVGLSDTGGDAEADILEIPSGTSCSAPLAWATYSIESGSGLPTGTTTMRPVALGLGNKIHVVYDDAANEIRHSIRDVSTNAWDSTDTVADNGNVLDDIFSVTTDGSSLWLLYMQDATTSVLQKCASPCTTTWSNLTAPFTSSDLTSADYPNLTYISTGTDLQACINNGSSSTAQDVICKTSDAATISWGSSAASGLFSSDYTDLSTTLSVSASTQVGFIIRDNTYSLAHAVTNGNISGLSPPGILQAEVNYGSNQRKIAYMPNATGGAAWYVFHSDANVISYRKCIASTNCDQDAEWSDNVSVDVDADAGDNNPSVWVEGDTIWIAWVDSATIGIALCCDTIETIQFRSLDTTSDTFGQECTTLGQGSLTNTAFVYIAVGDNGDVVVGYSSTSGDAEADIFEWAAGTTCSTEGAGFTSIETGSGLPTGTTTMRPVALGLGNKIHVVYDDAVGEIRHSIRDVSTGAWDSADTVADNGNIATDVFSVTTDGSSLWLLYSDTGASTVLQKCASPCTTTWSNLTAPFTSTDLTSSDFPNIGYISADNDLVACINDGSTTSAQELKCRGSDASTISWGSILTFGYGTSDYDNLSMTMSVTNAADVGIVSRDVTRAYIRFATVPERLLFLLFTIPLWGSIFAKLKKRCKKIGT